MLPNYLPNYLIFGGTFDPVHIGHIQVANAVQKHCHFDHFIFLPCKLPILKNEPQASPEHRISMLELALQEEEETNFHFEIDKREILRGSPSFMVTTLEDYRKELGENVSLTLLMGSDTLATLPLWHQWEKLLKLANLLAIHRPGFVEFPESIERLLQQHTTDKKEDLKNNSKGTIYRFNAGNFDHASSDIREQMKKKPVESLSLPETVKNYIKKNHLYKAH